MNVDILRVGPGSAAVLERVAEDVFDDDIDPARVAAYLAEPGHLMVLAVSGGEVVGQARGIVHRHPDLPTELYIDNLGVTPARKREGIATRLLDELVKWGREKGCEEAWVGDRARQRTGPRTLPGPWLGGRDVRDVLLRVRRGLAPAAPGSLRRRRGGPARGG